MSELELERTFLAKYIPSNISKAGKTDLQDIYIPINSPHARLRVRRRDDIFEITKKVQVSVGENSQMIEQTISLDEEEFTALAQVEGKRIHKTRYLFFYGEQQVELDIFLDELEGLVLIDFEFSNSIEMAHFTVPDFCLEEVTNEIFIAGGELCGKSFGEIEHQLKRFNYKRLTL